MPGTALPYMTILAVLIFVNQPDGDLAVSAEGSPTNEASEGECHVVEKGIQLVGCRCCLQQQPAGGCGIAAFD
jgi:hypothetical protein